MEKLASQDRSISSSKMKHGETAITNGYNDFFLVNI